MSQSSSMEPEFAEMMAFPAVRRLLTGTLDLPEVFQRLKQLARDRLGVDVVRIWLREGREEFRLKAEAGATRQPEESLTRRRGPGDELVRWIVEHRAPLVLPDVQTDSRLTNSDWAKAEGLVSFLGVPILLGNALTGVLVAMSRQRRAFSPEEVALAQALADSAAVAIRNARIYRRAKERAKKLTALSTLTRLITAASDSRQVFHAIAEAAATLMGAKLTRVWVADPEAQVLRAQADFGIDPDFVRVVSDVPTLRFGAGLAGSVYESRKPEYVSDVQQEHRWLDQRLAREAGLRAYAGIPLMTGGQVVGVLAILFEDRREFSSEEKELMSLLADQAAIAIERSRLFEELRRSYEKLEQAQEQLVRGETLRALGEMAAGAAHHLNNLLAVILGRVQLLLLHAKESELRRALEIVEQTTFRGAEVVRRMREFTRVQPVGEAIPVDLNQLAGDVLELTRPRWQDQAQLRGISIETRLEPGEIPAAAAESAALREVLMNLLLNAIDALPAGGQITIKTWASAERVYCSVTDTGMGMTTEVRRRALEPFFTTKGPRSIGLGLSLAYGILKRYDGDLAMESGEGCGTTVTLRLPVAPESVGPGLASPPAWGASLNILVIDDEGEVRRVLAEMLAALGHRVIQAAAGKQGLKILGNGTRFDLVLTDLGMPGMTGWEVAQAVKAHWPRLPVGLVTGWGEEPEATPEERQAADFVLAKPVKLESLREVIARVCPQPA